VSEAVLDLVDDCIGRGHRLDLLADAFGRPTERGIVEKLAGRVARAVDGEFVRLDRYAGAAARAGGCVEELVCGLAGLRGLQARWVDVEIQMVLRPGERTRLGMSVTRRTPRAPEQVGGSGSR